MVFLPQAFYVIDNICNCFINKDYFYLFGVCYTNFMDKKVTRTFLRTEETMNKYMEMSNNKREKGESVNPFLNWQDSLVKEFTHWVIIENGFPYDAIASVSHMLSTKRAVAFDWNLLNEDEKSEFELIKHTYLKETYDVLWENLPRGATFPAHFHLHLLILRREDI